MFSVSDTLNSRISVLFGADVDAWVIYMVLVTFTVLHCIYCFREPFELYFICLLCLVLLVVCD